MDKPASKEKTVLFWEAKVCRLSSSPSHRLCGHCQPCCWPPHPCPCVQGLRRQHGVLLCHLPRLNLCSPLPLGLAWSQSSFLQNLTHLLHHQQGLSFPHCCQTSHEPREQTCDTLVASRPLSAPVASVWPGRTRTFAACPVGAVHAAFER